MTRRASTLRALLASTHPGPTAAVTLISAVLAIAVGLDIWRSLLVVATVLTNQLSIGLSNDWLDAARDRAVGRADKPTVRGDVSVTAVRAAALFTATVSLVLGFVLSPLSGVANLLFVGAGWVYNAGLKASVYSTLLYAIGFGSLPAIVTGGLPQPSAPAIWAISLGALLGSAAHFANVLPDLDDDRRTGIRALPHRLGARRAGVVTFLMLLAASVIALIGPSGTPGVVPWLGLAASIALAISGIAIVLTRAPSRLLFRLIIAAALVDVIVLAGAGERMLA